MPQRTRKGKGKETLLPTCWTCSSTPPRTWPGQRTALPDALDSISFPNTSCCCRYYGRPPGPDSGGTGLKRQSWLLGAERQEVFVDPRSQLASITNPSTGRILGAGGDASLRAGAELAGPTRSDTVRL